MGLGERGPVQHQWKATEAAELFGITRPAFEQLLHRARTSLRTRYERLARTRLAGILLPLYRVKDTLATRIRPRLSAPEQSLNALGPTALDTIGQAAATVAVLGLVSGIVGGAASTDTSEQITGVPASALLPEVGGPDAGQSGAGTTTRHVDFEAPATEQTGQTAGGHVETTDTQDEISMDTTLKTRLPPLEPGIEYPGTFKCTGRATQVTTCAVIRAADDGEV